MKRPHSIWTAPSDAQDTLPASGANDRQPGGGEHGQQGASQTPDAAEQTRLFEQAVEMFQAQDFLGAKRGFERAAQGPLVEMAHAARQRARMCEIRLARNEPVLRNAEDRYNYAVVLVNQRRWEEAEAHLEQALAENPGGDHLYYAMALCRCWRGDLEGASKCMRRAIELQPNNLIAARSDPDFARFIQQSPLAELFGPDRNRPA